MELIDEVLHKIKISKLETYEGDLLRAFKIAKMVFSNPDMMIRNELYTPGICFVLDTSVQHVMDNWRKDLSLSCWEHTSYWIEPAYSDKKTFKELCKQRELICDAIIKNLTDR